MNAIRFLKGLAVTMATFGILLPYPAITNASENLSGDRQAETVRDVELGAGGVLRGQVVTKEGLPNQGALVTVRQNDGVVATTQADEHGAFAVSGLAGGVYAINSDKSAGVIRAWSHRTAPPAASQGVLLVPRDLTVRGQGRLHDLLHGPNGLSLGQIGLGGLLVLGLVGTVIAISVSRDAS